jgi:hypothetical protein
VQNAQPPLVALGPHGIALDHKLTKANVLPIGGDLAVLHKRQGAPGILGTCSSAGEQDHCH